MPPQAARCNKDDVRWQAAAVPSSTRSEGMIQLFCEPSQIGRTLPTNAPRASSSDSDRQQSWRLRQKCRSWHQLVEQSGDAQSWRPLVNIVEINRLSE